jgi:hypothetical protein
MGDKRIGNSYWAKRLDMSKDGRKLSVEEFVNGCQEYIDRCENEKLYEIDFKGANLQEVQIPKMITMSIYGACAHIGINYNTWKEWRKDEKYSHIINNLEGIFKAYNIEGASAGFLNSSIISRLEGLKDQTDITSDDKAISKNVIMIGGQEIEI